MGLLPYLLIFLLPFSFGYLDENPKSQSEGYSEIPEFQTTEYLNLFTSEPACPENENFSSCNAHCESTCSTLKNPVPCSDECVSGCVCNEGYVRDFNGKCIPEESCVEEELSEEQDFCPPNEVFSPCFAHCQKNCTNWSDPTVPCLKICVPGCICDKGMVRGPYGNCVQPRKCPTYYDLQSYIVHQSVGDMLLDCPVNEHYARCSAHCQKNCANWNQQVICPLICVPGCVCDKDFVRGPFGKCVLTERCSFLSQKLKITKKSLNSCPEGERKSSLKPVTDSNLLCRSQNGVVEFCPPTFLDGCVCERGQVRGKDNRCIDRRLLPNANEIHFIHDDNKEVGQQTSDFSTETTEESYDLREASEKSSLVFTTTPSVTPDEDLNVQSNSDDEISTTTTQDASTENLISSYVDSEHGCPDHEKCNAWCKSEGARTGACLGPGRSTCICFD